MGEGENWALTCEDEMEIKSFLEKKKMAMGTVAISWEMLPMGGWGCTSYL